MDPPWSFKRTPEQLAAYHATNDAIYASEIGTAALAGSLVLLTATLLGRFKADASATLADWNEAGPRIRGHSIGRIVWAAGNAFRHTDEWAEARHSGTFTGQQRASMDILRDVLRPDPVDILDRPEWEVALDIVSGGSLDGLTANVLRFADDVAVRLRAR